MPVTINGSGSISGLSVGSLGAGVVNTATLANGAITSSILPAGVLLQLITSATTSVVNWSSGWTDTGLTANITPQFANSKIIMTVYAQTHIYGTYDHGIGYKFLRGSTAIMTTATNKWQYFYDGSNEYQERGGSVLSFEDTSHNSTSALTYKLQFNSYRSDNNNAVSFCRDNSRASMQLMEIKV